MSEKIQQNGGEAEKRSLPATLISAVVGGVAGAATTQGLAKLGSVLKPKQKDEPKKWADPRRPDP